METRPARETFNLLSLKQRYDELTPTNKVPAKFSFSHIILALLLFDLHGKLGRVALQNELGLGRGSLRTFIARLKDGLGLIEARTTSAHVLSPEGVHAVDTIKSSLDIIGNIPEIFTGFMFAGFNALAHLVTGMPASDVEQALEPMQLVSVAKEYGGIGLLSVVVQPERTLSILQVPLDIKKQYSTEWVKLNELFSLVEGDLLLVASADTERDAKLAAIAAAIAALEMLEH
jgi:hypothetical protein